MLFRDILEARTAWTAAQFEAVSEDAAAFEKHVRPQLVRSHVPPRSQEQSPI